MQASNKKPVKQLFKTLMKAMNDHDPDVAEMAAKDLCTNIKDGTVDLKAPQNKQLSQNIVQDYLKQVGSLNFVVHSAAIRCLAEIVPYLSKQELIFIFKSTISSITDPKTQAKRMQVFSSSANTMINLAPADIGIDLSSLFVQCVNQFLKLSSKKNSKQQEDVIIHLLHLLIDFSEKWPDVVGSRQVQFDRQLLIQILLRNIEGSTKLDIARKSDVALEKLSAIFDKSNFQFVLNHKDFGLLKYILRHQKAEDEEGMKMLRNGISCLNHIVHSHNRELKPWAKEITRLCIGLVQNYKNNSENIVLVSQIIESSIDCLTSLIKAYSSQLSEWVGTGKYLYLSSFLQQTLNFDLQGMMQYLNMDQQQMEEEVDQYQFNQNAVCWKVREVSLNYTTVLMRKDPQFKDKKGKSVQFLQLLSSKLIEENQNVSKKAFECFNFIIQSISTTKKEQDQQQGTPLKRVKSNQGNFALQLVDKISDRIQVLFNHKRTKQQTKTEAAKTLLNLIQLLHQIIQDNQAACHKILSLIQKLLPRVKPDSCIFLIRSSKSLINGSLSYEKAIATIDVYLKMCKSNNFKVVAASFDGLRNSMKHYHEKLLKTGKIDQILNILIPKLKQHDADKLVKIQAIRCLGPIFIYIFKQLPEKTQNELLSAAEAKLKVEIDKVPILSQIPRIPQDYVVKKSQQNTFKNILDICSETIGITNFEISNLSVQSCNRIIRLQGLTINQKTVQSILNKSRPMLIQQKIPKFLDPIIQKFPNTLKAYAESIIKTGDRYYIKKLIQKKIVSPERCIQLLKTTVSADNTRKLSLILSQIQPSRQKLLAQLNDSKWGLVCLGALGYVGDLSTIENIQKFFISNQNHDLKFEGARCIGNIASRYPQYATKLIDLSRKSTEGYLYLHALKQMLSFSQKQFPNIQNVIHFIFSKSQQGDRQTNKHLLAECIGNLSRISHKQLKSILNSVNEMNHARKFIVASSLRYAFQNIKKNQIIDNVLEDYIQKIVQLTRDYDVNVRQGALKSLNSLTQGHLQQIRHCFDQKFIQSLFDSMTIKAQLIKQIDYGVSKEKKDLGKGLRIQAFNFLKSIISTRQLQKYYERIIGKCLENINKQTSNDLILKRVLIIRLICEKDFTSFVPHQNQFAIKLGTQGVLKSYLSSNAADDERSQGYIKGLFKQILTIMKLSTESTQAIRALINKIKINQKLKVIIQGVENSQ